MVRSQIGYNPLVIKVLCCNDCAGEIKVVEPPARCPHCDKPFVHGWDELMKKAGPEARPSR